MPGCWIIADSEEVIPIIDLTYFTEEEELEELTGLNRDQLWDAGFDLDDWDFGFRTKTKIHKDVDVEYGYYDSDDTYTETHIELADEYGDYYYLWNFIEGNCVGCKATFYNGYWYYMEYHS